MNTRQTLRTIAAIGGALLLGLHEVVALARSRRAFSRTSATRLGSLH
jgi:hypothetical protein